MEAEAKRAKIPEIRLDRSGAVLELNQAAAELLAITPAEILAKPASLVGEPWGSCLRTPQTGPLRWRHLPDGSWIVSLVLPPTSDQLNDLREALNHADPDEAKDLLLRAAASILLDSPGGVWQHDDGLLLPLLSSGGAPQIAVAATDVWSVRLGRPLLHQGPLALPALPVWKGEEPVESVPLYLGAHLVGLLIGPPGAWTQGEGAKLAADARRVFAADTT